ncbi:DNA-binding CsgD family transcriptional regulator [Pelomonas saccharophila]|uniref:DNA-binding CsgD family transcriptional regulator n=1 Tax=Roseateles saccharophilus TaxID=304 RepID=A0ABU1YKJ6_ROSSA|nr:helix-turn-helix transcriptional regulator [Roseateles saccharophilus]MDR7269385.1 DNA-binding CsgD family transcriptional regulator [Roseateles saccharophilus]
MLDSIARTEGLTASTVGFRQPRPALTSAPARAHQDTAPVRLDASEFTEILEELDTGVIVCSETGRLAQANNVARRELLRGQPLAVDDTGLLYLAEGAQGALRQWQAALRAATLSHHRQMLALSDGPQRLMVSVMPLGRQGRWALVMLGRRQPAPDLAVEMLGSLYALTSAEQQVLVGLLAGQRVEAIACERGVTVATLRSQVGSLREKLGAARLEDLVRLAAGLPPMSSVLRSPPLWADARSPDGGQARAA